MRVLAVLNPRAGLAARRALGAVERGRPSWKHVQVKVTSGPGHARDLARAAAEQGFDLVLAVGGDGTANEVAWGLLDSRTTLGLVPVGSGNGLARTLGISRTPERALATLEGGVRRRMDVGLANGRPFLNLAGAGFDAAVGAEFHARGQEGGRRGLLPYVLLSLARTFSYQARTWTLRAGTEGFEGRALIVAFVNGREYGGAAVIAPGARLDDGLLDVVVIEDTTRLGMLLNAPRLFVGRIEGFSRYRHIPAAEAVLLGPRPFGHHRDGEPEAEAERLEVRVRPRALEILVPRATAEDPNGPFSAE